MNSCRECSKRVVKVTRGLCRGCYDKGVRTGAIVKRPPRWTPDELLDEWVFMRGWTTWEEFGPRVGMKQATWERAFYRASAKGDPRAVRARNDPLTWPDPAAGISHVLDATKAERDRKYTKRRSQEARSTK